MIEETGTVIAEEGSGVWIQVAGEGACPRCREGGGCGQQSMARLLGDRVRRVLVDNSIGARIGDRVLMGVEPHALVMASVVTYLLPLIGLILGALVADAAGTGGDGVTIAGALAGGAVAVAAGRYLNHRTALGARLRPRLLRRLPEAVCADKTYLT